MKLNIIPASDNKHKFIGIFIDDQNKETRIPFGQYGALDYTMHKNVLRRDLYINRHKTREFWNKPMTAGALSRWILWNKPSLDDSIKDFKRRFHLE